MIRFKNSDAAERCVLMLQGSVWNGRIVECEHYDGVTDYRSSKDCTETSAEEQAKNLETFGDWLEADSDEDA